MLNRNLKILLLEDDEDDALLLKEKLKEHPDYSKLRNLIHKKTIKETLEYIENNNQPDVIVADLGLPESQGLDTFLQLKKVCRSIPIVVLTGLEDIKTTAKIMARGAQDYLIKADVTADSFVRSIAYAIERSKTAEQSRLFFEAAPSGMIMIDENGVIVMSNRQTEKYFGYTRDELIGQKVEMLIPERFKKEHPKLRNSFFQNPHKRGMGGKRDLYGMKKNGEELPIEIGLNPIQTSSGLRVVASIIDITERKQMEAVKDQFIGMASHELRTPMAVIQMAIANLKDELIGNLNDKQKKVAKIISSNAERLNKIVNSLLDISRLESGKVEPKLTPVNPKVFLNEAIEGLEQLAEEKGLELVYKVDEKIRDEFQLDAELIIQVVNNLTSNALRYAETQILIEIKEVENGIEFSVSNDGSYLSPDDISKLFKKFSQIRRPKGGTGYKGTGLGLAICKEIIKKHDGEIWVESEKGALTSFKFVLHYS